MFQLQRWSEQHRRAFAEMHSARDVMADYQGGPLSLAESGAKFDRYRDGWTVHGISRWAVVGPSGIFLGYAGVMRNPDVSHPLGPHHEIGWRFCRDAWGRGIATESAREALARAWPILNTSEIFSYTAADNVRSQGVMQRLDLRRDPTRDFTARTPRGNWSGLVWIAERPLAGLNAR